MSEAEHLDSQGDGGAADDFHESECQEMYSLYTRAKNTRTGGRMLCPGCGKSIVKTTYNKVFCSNGRTVKGKSSCKDFFWNTINPRGIFQPQ